MGVAAEASPYTGEIQVDPDFRLTPHRAASTGFVDPSDNRWWVATHQREFS
jgi:hypothetical protein